MVHEFWRDWSRGRNFTGAQQLKALSKKGKKNLHMTLHDAGRKGTLAASDPRRQRSRREREEGGKGEGFSP